MAEVEQILYFLDEEFQPSAFPDYPHALNGLQVEGPAEIKKIAAAVDACEATIATAALANTDLLLVHHGLFWGGLGPITGPLFRKLAGLMQANMALYSLHLPLDAHAELGNNALLAQGMGLAPEARFGTFREVEIGWWCRAGLDRNELVERLEQAVNAGVRVIPGGPSRVERVGILSGGGASALHEAASQGLDTLVTGEAPHHAYHDAMELGLNLLLGGHYATETFGVEALAQRLAEEFHVSWEFLDQPTGL
jgi:dinuclear metal center YbgI/SA1388 family protein